MGNLILGIIIGVVIGVLYSANKQDKYLARLIEYYNNDYEKVIVTFFSGKQPWVNGGDGPGSGSGIG